MKSIRARLLSTAYAAVGGTLLLGAPVLLTACADNPCRPAAAAAVNPCNPCAAKAPCSPCAAANPCAAKAACNPCAAAASPCAAQNPCAARNPCAAASPCAAANPCAAKNPCAATAKPGSAVNVDTAGVAVHGYDPVAYFTQGGPVLGDAAFSATHDGATYRFASAEHRAAFVADPARYAPQYGGYCAFGAAKGGKFDGDPSLWRIVDDKLYLNVNPTAQQLWEEDVPGFIQQADVNWPEIKDKDPSAL